VLAIRCCGRFTPSSTTKYIALKTLEKYEETRTKVVIFDLEGKYEVLTELDGTKFEGLEFLH